MEDYIGVNSNKRKFGLDFLRALAIILVLLGHFPYLITLCISKNSHLFGNLTMPIGKLCANVTSHGYGAFGVSLFFVLSGFLIGQILIREFSNLQGFKTIKNFWLRRWIRTLPNYYLFLFINTILFYFLYKIFIGFPNWFKYLFFAQNLFNRLPEFFGESWSLTVEEWFYILTPLIALFIYYFFKVKNSKAVLYSAIILFFSSIFIRFLYLNSFKYTIHDLRPAISLFDGVSLGVIFSFFKKDYKNAWTNKRLHFIFLFISLSLLSVCVYFSRPSDHRAFIPIIKVFYQTIIYFAFALLIPISDSWNCIANGWKKFIQLISAWSYSIYLTNLVVIKIFVNILNKSSLNLVPILLVILFIPAVLIISRFIYNEFEKPILDLRDNIIK